MCEFWRIALQLVNIQEFRKASIEDICSVHELSYVRGLEKLSQRGKGDIVESVAPTYITGTSFDNALAVQPSRTFNCVHVTADAALFHFSTLSYARHPQVILLLRKHTMQILWSLKRSCNFRLREQLWSWSMQWWLVAARTALRRPDLESAGPRATMQSRRAPWASACLVPSALQPAMRSSSMD
jgi:hypothetical protein